MPLTARQMNNLVIIRSLSTREGDHNRGTQLMHTAYTPNPAIDFPTMGSVVAQQAPLLQGYQEISLPNFIGVNAPMGSGGFLGMNYAPFNVSNPGSPPENIRPPQGIGRSDNERIDRVRRRQRLFYTLEDGFRRGRAPFLVTEEDRAKFNDPSKAHADIYGKGFSIVASKEGQVFDIRREPANVQAAYGNSNFGRGALLARRLVEAGVSAVEISLGGWDTHNQNFNALSRNQLPTLDKAMGTLVRELVERGMWRNTVLVWMGDFGRTPRINQNAGRDHWPRCWSVVIGGGALRNGQAYGRTDQDGMAIAENPTTVMDVFATVYRALGIDPATQVRDPIGRPFPIAGLGGRPIEALF
jgi:hypothetical protein